MVTVLNVSRADLVGTKMAEMLMAAVAVAVAVATMAMAMVIET